MRMSRALVPTTVSGVLAASLLTGAPSVAASDTHGDPWSRVTAAQLPAVPVPVPGLRARSAGVGTVAVGQDLVITWADERYDGSLHAYYTALALTGAIDGQDYRLTLSGAGPLSAFVVDAQGEPVAYAEHPDAAVAAPTLEWEYAAGDQLLLVSDDLPLAAPTARISVATFTNVEMPWLPTTPLDTGFGGIAGELSPTDAHIPFHGGHVSSARTRPTDAAPGQDRLVLAFDGSAEDTDWLSVVVLDDQRTPIDEIRVKAGLASFTLTAGQSFVVTSYAPDEFGSYTYQWMMPGTPEVAGVGDPGWWDTNALPSYRVQWRWSARTPALSSGMFPSEKVTHKVEVSTDGRSWKQGVVANPAQDVLDDGTSVVLADGSYRLRVVTQVGEVRGVSAAFPFEATGDEAGWRITGLRLSAPPLLDIPGEEANLVDLRRAVTATQVYRDGRTRTRTLPLAPVVRYQFDRSVWRTMGGDVPWISIPESGLIQVTSHDGKVRSNTVLATVPQLTGAYRAAVTTPTRSASVGGAMVFTGRISRQYTDKWRPVHERSWYRIQHKSGKKWVDVFSGRTTVKSTGGFSATVPLAGPGSYRLVVGKAKVLSSWKLSPATATKTARIAKPSVKKSGKGRYAVGVDIDQRYSDGLWGPGWSGWKYQIQHRPVGSRKWRSTKRHAVTQSAAFQADLRASGTVELRIRATYKGKTYYSPISHA